MEGGVCARAGQPPRTTRAGLHSQRPLCRALTAGSQPAVCSRSGKAADLAFSEEGEQRRAKARRGGWGGHSGAWRGVERRERREDRAAMVKVGRDSGSWPPQLGH